MFYTQPHLLPPCSLLSNTHQSQLGMPLSRHPLADRVPTPDSVLVFTKKTKTLWKGSHTSRATHHTPRVTYHTSHAHHLPPPPLLSRPSTQSWLADPLTNKCNGTRIRNGLEYVRACQTLQVPRCPLMPRCPVAPLPPDALLPCRPAALSPWSCWRPCARCARVNVCLCVHVNMCVCVHVNVCVCARARAPVCVCVQHVDLGTCALCGCTCGCGAPRR